MQRLKNIERLVLDILIYDPTARADDYILYHEVVREYFARNGLLAKFLDITFSEVMLFHDKLHIPSYETVTRCRRKLQAEYPELKDIAAEITRSEAEKKFRAYAAG